jgi:hypothetical protein
MLGISDESAPMLGAVYQCKGDIHAEEAKEFLANSVKIAHDVDNIINIGALADIAAFSSNKIVTDLRDPGWKIRSNPCSEIIIPFPTPILNIKGTDFIRPGITIDMLSAEDLRLFPHTNSFSYSWLNGCKNHCYFVGSELDMHNITAEYLKKFRDIDLRANDMCIVSSDNCETRTYIFGGQFWKFLAGTDSQDSYIEECGHYKSDNCCLAHNERSMGYDEGWDDAKSEGVTAQDFYAYLKNHLEDGHAVCLDNGNLFSPASGIVRFQMFNNRNVYISDESNPNIDKHFDLGLGGNDILILKDNTKWWYDEDADEFFQFEKITPTNEDDVEYIDVCGVRHYIIDEAYELNNYTNAPRGSIAVKNTVSTGSTSATNTVWKKLDRGWVMMLCEKGQ